LPERRGRRISTFFALRQLLKKFMRVDAVFRDDFFDLLYGFAVFGFFALAFHSGTHAEWPVEPLQAPQSANLGPAQWVKSAGYPAFVALDRQEALGKVDAVPFESHELGDPLPVPVGK
jgi:hypothetical protein